MWSGEVSPVSDEILQTAEVHRSSLRIFRGISALLVATCILPLQLHSVCLVTPKMIISWRQPGPVPSRQQGSGEAEASEMTSCFKCTNCRVITERLDLSGRNTGQYRRVGIASPGEGPIQAPFPQYDSNLSLAASLSSGAPPM